MQQPGQVVGHIFPQTRSLKSSTPDYVEMPAFKAPTLKVMDASQIKRKAFTFAHAFEVNLSPDNAGQWHTLASGQRIWQLTIHSANATSINLIFSQYKLPPGGQLFIYNKEMSHILGAFTEANNKTNGILPTMPVMGDEITVEYQAPLQPAFEAELCIGSINHDYTNVFNHLKLGYFGDSEVCEKDVSCFTNELYKKIRRSTVKIIINGTELMSGTLLNTTNNDGRPYIITAAHGFKDYSYSAAKTLFVFNYQVPLCYTEIEGTREQSIAGGTILSYSPLVNDNTCLDFALVAISIPVPTAYRPYFAGWNRQSISPTNSFCIHHPAGDVKKISFDDNALTMATLHTSDLTYYTNGHWKVGQWDEGVTEGGSSGAGLFNPSGQLIGGLSAGAASCSSPYNDYFFRFDLAWNTYADSSRQLACWLDADQTNAPAVNAFEAPEVIATSRLTHMNDSSNISAVEDEIMGNIAGNNALGISHFVEKFISDGTQKILGFYFTASKGTSSSVVNITLWEGNDLPENEIYSAPLLIKKWEYGNTTLETGSIGGFTLKTEFAMQENFVLLPEPIAITGNYFIGFEVDNTQQSSPFGLLVNTHQSEDNAYYYSNAWYSYLDLPEFNTATSLWIDPVVQSSNNSFLKDIPSKRLKVFPNPVRNGEALTLITPITEMASLAIFDLLGKHYPIHIINQTNTDTQLDVQHLPQGVYILNTGMQQVLFQKL